MNYYKVNNMLKNLESIVVEMDRILRNNPSLLKGPSFSEKVNTFMGIENDDSKRKRADNTFNNLTLKNNTGRGILFLGGENIQLKIPNS